MGQTMSFFSYKPLTNDDNITSTDAGVCADPRSPTTAFARTPHAGAKHEQAHFVNDAFDDPRSPTLLFRRTPLFGGARSVDLADPRSPLINRTPLRARFDLRDPREPASARTPLTASSVAVSSSSATTTPLPARRLARRLANEMELCDADESLLSFDDNNDSNNDDFDDMKSCDERAADSSFVDVMLGDDDDDDNDDDNNDAQPATSNWSPMALKQTKRYVMLTPPTRGKRFGTPRLSLCASAIKAAVSAAVASSARRAEQGARADELQKSFASRLLDGVDNVDDESSSSNSDGSSSSSFASEQQQSTADDGAKSRSAAPPSPFAVLHAAGMAYRPRVLGAPRQSSSCPSSPAA